MKFLIARVDAELIILPEPCNTGYLFTSRREAEELGEEIPTGRISEVLCGLARPKNNYSVAGITEREGGRLYKTPRFL